LPYIKTFVVVFAIGSIAFSWFISLIQLPMPVVDFSYLEKLSKVEKESPERYKQLMNKMAKDSAKKDKQSTIMLSAIVYIATFTFITTYWFSVSLSNLSYFLEMAMPGAFIVMLCSYGIIKSISKNWLKWFFRKYPDTSAERSRTFLKIQRKLLFIKLAIPLVISIGYALVTLTSN
jgi:hypothetical protein